MCIIHRLIEAKEVEKALGDYKGEKATYLAADPVGGYVV